MISAMPRIKEGDMVQVMVGRSRGRSGKVLRVDRKRERVLVEKVNMVKRHMKPSKQHPQGGIVEKESGVHWSSVMLLCATCGKPRRSRVVKSETGKSLVCVKCERAFGN